MILRRGDGGLIMIFDLVVGIAEYGVTMVVFVNTAVIGVGVVVLLLLPYGDVSLREQQQAHLIERLYCINCGF